METIGMENISYIFNIKSIIEDNNFDRSENFSHVRDYKDYNPNKNKLTNEINFLDDIFSELNKSYNIPKEFIHKEIKRIKSNVQKGSLYFTLENEILENYINVNIKDKSFKVLEVSVHSCTIIDENNNHYNVSRFLNKNLIENINKEIEEIKKVEHSSKEIQNSDISVEDKVRNSILELYDKYTNPDPGESIDYTEMGDKISSIINDIFMGPTMGDFSKETAKENLLNFMSGFIQKRK